MDPPNKIPLVHYRSKTILLIVEEVQDVAPIAALCALLGDLYRHRTLFSKEPILVLRVVVRNHIRHYFVTNNTITTWRAHEASSASARWATHVGAPDSIWSFEQEGLERAFWGRPIQGNPLTQDDGGMADMILVGSASSLTLWQCLAQLIESLPTRCHSDSAPPLVIATLGSLRGVDWISRMAFGMRPKQSAIITKDIQRRRFIALVGFPSTLWYCRLIRDDGAKANAKKIKTQHAQDNSIVLMIGKRDSSSTADQDVSLITTPELSTSQRDQVLRLLRQSLFPPDTLVEIMPPPVTSPPTLKQSAKPYLYNLLWSLLQDPHMIQFPCLLAQKAGSASITAPRKLQTLGSLILSVLEEVVLALHRLHADLLSRQQHHPSDEAFCQALLHPLEESLLAKLLGTGGSLVEDLTNNRRIEWLARIRYNNNNRAALHQRWILEPLATRAALAEWQVITQHSPYPSSTKLDSVMIQQLAIDHVQLGLGLVLQLGTLLSMQEQLPTLKWVVERVNVAAIPLEAWGVVSVKDLYQFLVRHPPLGGQGGVEQVTRLLSKL